MNQEEAKEREKQEEEERGTKKVWGTYLPQRGYRKWNSHSYTMERQSNITCHAENISHSQYVTK